MEGIFSATRPSIQPPNRHSWRVSGLGKCADCMSAPYRFAVALPAPRLPSFPPLPSPLLPFTILAPLGWLRPPQVALPPVAKSVEQARVPSLRSADRSATLRRGLR